MKLTYLKFLLFALTLLTGCAGPGEQRKLFEHELGPGPTPWFHENFDDAPDKFTFGMITDLNGGERERIFEVAVAQLNLLRPEFVLSVGDLIDGGTEDIAQLEKEWNSFDDRAAKLKSPFFHLGGNHDLTNVVMRDFWKDRYGPRYYHFIYKDVLFLMMDSEDYPEERMHEIYLARAEAIKVLDGPNPEEARDMEYFQMPERRTGEIGKEQSKYFRKVLSDHPNVRWTFVLMHKPVWLREEPDGFTEVEADLQGRPYTVINGHFHNYAYEKRSDQDYIMLGTTGGSQNANSQMAFDHVSLITMTSEGPTMANLRLDGILNKQGKIPLNGDTLCFQASRCQ